MRQTKRARRAAGAPAETTLVGKTEKRKAKKEKEKEKEREARDAGEARRGRAAAAVTRQTRRGPM